MSLTGITHTDHSITGGADSGDNLEIIQPILVKVKLAHQICDKFVQYCKDQLIVGLGYKKFDIQRALEAFLALCSEKVMVGDSAIRLSYLKKLGGKTDSGKNNSKLGDIYSDYLENLTMFYTSAQTLAPIIGNNTMQDFVKEIGKMVDYFAGAEKTILGISNRTEPPGIREIYGGEADDGVIDLGGFLGTEIISYPLGGAAINGVEFYLGQISPYETAIVDSILEYLTRRDPEFVLPENPDVVSAIGLVHQQDTTLFLHKLQDKIHITSGSNAPDTSHTAELGDTMEKWWEDITQLGLNPFSRRTLMRSISEALTDLRAIKQQLKLVKSPTDTPVDMLLQRLFNTTNTLGYAIDTLLSPDNKATCINNMAYYVGYIVMAQKIYSEITDMALRKTLRDRVDIIFQQHPELKITTYWDPRTKSIAELDITRKTGLFAY